ncbi:MAG TPA: 1-(5-phosphoribosyl)-5-[(5-phosphoribosylamino)methylideneamino] imidazole-4-carboxamide isomerase [Candidatus Dormibacteraeota bacterium]
MIPTIEVQGGRCVRPPRGEHAQPTVFSGDPTVLARTFIDEGAPRLHVVDLDAARGIPTSESADAVAGIVDVCVASSCEVEVGGGVRSVDVALRWLGEGASLVVVGSVAAREPELAMEICEAAGGQVLLSLDVHAGISRVQGWTEDGLAATELLRLWRHWQAAGLVYTDTTRDGLLTGPNLDGLQICEDLYGGPVIAAGGIGSLDDIAACAAAGAAGVLVGWALHEGRVDLASALRTFANPPEALAGPT